MNKNINLYQASVLYYILSFYEKDNFLLNLTFKTSWYTSYSHFSIVDKKDPLIKKNDRSSLTFYKDFQYANKPNYSIASIMQNEGGASYEKIQVLDILKSPNLKYHQLYIIENNLSFNKKFNYENNFQNFLNEYLYDDSKYKNSNDHLFFKNKTTGEMKIFKNIFQDPNIQINDYNLPVYLKELNNYQPLFSPHFILSNLKFFTDKENETHIKHILLNHIQKNFSDPALVLEKYLLSCLSESFNLNEDLDFVKKHLEQKSQKNFFIKYLKTREKILNDKPQFSQTIIDFIENNFPKNLDDFKFLKAIKNYNQKIEINWFTKKEYHHVFEKIDLNEIAKNTQKSYVSPPSLRRAIQIVLNDHKDEYDSVAFNENGHYQLSIHIKSDINRPFTKEKLRQCLNQITDFINEYNTELTEDKLLIFLEQKKILNSMEIIDTQPARSKRKI